MKTDPCRLYAGDILGSRYRIVSVAGRGGMGTVYLAEDLKLKGKRWAVKETLRHARDYQRFIDEAEMLIRLQHVHLPGIVDYFPPDDEGFSYLVMDYIEGETLVERFDRTGGQVGAAAAVNYALQLCDLFHYLHDELPVPMIYRDLKPSNIMIDGQEQVRLIDFGIARHFKNGSPADTVRVGTVGFAAPEQFQQLQTDRRTDLYSLGAVLYYLLSGGKYPYSSTVSLARLNKEVPESLSAVVGKLLEPEPDNRYPNAGKLRADLAEVYAELCGDEGQPARSGGFLGPVVIAVCGTGRGVGCTHTAVLLAHFLARKRRSVVLAEANASGHFGRIEAVYEGSDEPLPGSAAFDLRGVRYAKAGDGLDMIGTLSGSYEFVVLDLGSYDETEWFGEFMRAAVQVVVGTGCEWKRRDIAKFFRSHFVPDPAKCSLFVPLATPQMARDIRRMLPDVRLVALPAHTDPFCHQQETSELLDGWLGFSEPLKRGAGSFMRRWFRAQASK
ncbi:serine/threonine protein kinase [Paenibacillus sp. 1P03SA]|uniref:serine/threonine protein kinase n=1 Tax=Paenibacillus sp. 1P03SA TaxID=3132294 RepID=UPI0039A07D3B